MEAEFRVFLGKPEGGDARSPTLAGGALQAHEYDPDVSLRAKPARELRVRIGHF